MNKKYVGLVLAILVLIQVTVVLGEDLSEYSSKTFESSLASKLKDILDAAEKDHPKLRMEMTRRIDFYFHISNRIDALMNIYTENLIPFMCQRDLFQGNTIKDTPPLLRSPAVSDILNLFIRILQPFYALAILMTGMYLLFVSGSPKGRARAKSTLIKLIIGLGLITLTLPLAETFLEISHYLTSMFLSIPGIEDVSPPIDLGMFMVVKEFFMKYFLSITLFEIFVSLPFLALLIMLPTGVFMVLAVRYFMVILLTMFFPFTVLLYSFIGTKRIGGTLLNQTFLWIFVPVIDALILLVTWITYKSIFSIPEIIPLLDVSTFIVFSGFLMLIIAPLMALKVMSWAASLGLISSVLMEPVAMTMTYVEGGGKRDGGDEEYINLEKEIGK